MTDFDFDVGDKVYTVRDVPDFETAQKQFNAYRQQEVSEAGRKQFEEAPWWGKLGMAGSDMLRSGIDTVSLGGADAMADYMAGNNEQRMLTKAAKERAGWAGTAGDVVAATAMFPTAVPKVVGMVGGGPGVRALTAGGTAAAEGGTMGAINAATHDQDPMAGAGIGGITGVLGQAAGGIVNKGKRVWDELNIPAVGKVGKTFEAPTYNILKLPKGADKMTKVNVAAAKAEQRAKSNKEDPLALQDAYASQFSKLQASPGFKKEFNKAEKEQIEKIIKGDFGTNTSRQLSSVVGNPWVAASSGPMVGLPLLTAGRSLKSLSSGGTEEAVRDLRRTMYGVDKFKGPLSPEWIKRMRQGSRVLGQELYND